MYTYIYIYIYIHIHMYINIYTYMQIYRYIYIHIYILHFHKYIHIYTPYIYAYICKYINIYAHIYTYISMHGAGYFRGPFCLPPPHTPTHAHPLSLSFPFSCCSIPSLPHPVCLYLAPGDSGGGSECLAGDSRRVRGFGAGGGGRGGGIPFVTCSVCECA